jgi:hypothetical protein
VFQFVRPTVTRKFKSLCLAAIPLLFAGTAAQATTVSPNTGSLGAAANGTNADSVTFAPGVVTGGGDQTAVYDGATGKTTVPFQSGLNPAATSPFTIEFWGKPTASDNDDAPVSNRVSAGNRSGWVFFQRASGTGWNFRMYNGAGSALGWDLTGGFAPLNEWSHVVATWDGSAAALYVNGALAASTNAAGLNGVYNASTSADFIVAQTDSGSPYTGSVDEVAFYPSALSLTQIQNHFNTVASPIAGAYQSLVQADGARLQLSNNAVPEPSAMMLLGAASMMLFRRRLSRR